MLQEEGHHALMGREGGPVNHPGGVELAVRALVLEAKASRLSKVELHRGDRLFPPRHRLKLDVDLGAVESCFSGAVKIVPTELIKNLRKHPLGVDPGIRIVNVLFLALLVLRIPARQAHPVISHPKYGVGLLVHLEDGLKFVFDLRFRAVDVGIVHAHAAHPHEAAHGARFLPAIHLTVLREAQR